MSWDPRSLSLQTIRPIRLASLLLLVNGGLSSLCQMQPAVPSQAQVATMQDLTRPEVQPRLDVDHDPIPSPDHEEIAPAIVASSSPAPAHPGEIQKVKDGIYTMHQDTDEVLLSCAAVDEKGRLVTDLSRGDCQIWEDGVPQMTTSFAHLDQPVSLGILVDNSGSMLDKRAAVNATTLNLLGLQTSG